MIVRTKPTGNFFANNIMFWTLIKKRQNVALKNFQADGRRNPQKNNLGGAVQKWTQGPNGITGHLELRPLVDQLYIHLPWPPRFLLLLCRKLLHPTEEPYLPFTVCVCLSLGRKRLNIRPEFPKFLGQGIRETQLILGTVWYVSASCPHNSLSILW